MDGYTYTVDWSAEDGVYVARVAEFPSLSAHGHSHEEALKELRFVVEVVIKDLEEEGAPVPRPQMH